MYFSHRENFYKYPGRLTWLCAEALGKFISSVFKKLVVQKQQHLVKEVREYVQHMLHTSTPESIADEMKIRILREYEKAYMELSRLYDSEDDYLEVATEIFIAILDPSTTRIECIEHTCHPKLLDGFKMRYSDLIFSGIKKLKNVKVLRIGEASFFNKRHELGDRISETIEEFCYGMTSNRDIRTLCEQCKGLRILDFGDSSDVYEEIIPHILNLECLEELDLHNSSIYRGGFQKLMNGLVKTKRSDGKFASEYLRRLACDKLVEEQVFLVANKFPNLVSLSFYAECDLIPLKSLKHLKHFDVRTNCYSYLKELLSFIGRHLVCLKMCCVADADLDHVATTCISLKCLHLENSPRAESISKKMFIVPEFPKIESLELNYVDESGIVTQHLLPHFKNLRRLYLLDCGNDDVFDFVLQRKFMKHLEVVFFQKFYDTYVALQFFEKYAVITDFPEHFSEHPICIYSIPI